MKLKLFILLLLVCLTSCKLVSIGQESAKTLSSKPMLGTVGSFQNNIISSSFNEAGVPEFEGKLKLSVEKVFFNKHTLKQYNNKTLSKENVLKIVDSLDLNPSYLKLEISDKVGLVNTLNNDKNKDLKNYIKITRDKTILTSVWMYFPEEFVNLIEKSKELYIINNHESSYSIEVLNMDNTRQIVSFKKGTVFGYDFSSFCWTENYKHEAVIAAFREVNGPCPGNTKKNPKKVTSKDLFDNL
jgi:hypothetical protein